MPITFKDITLIDYIKKYNLSKNKSYNLLINMNLTNVQELIDYLTIHPEDYTREFIKIIDYANNTLEKINNGENTSKIYEIPSKLTTKEFINFNNTCDKSTSADNLIMFNLTSNDYLKTILNDYNIYYIKYLLNHYNYKGENALVVSLDSFGPKKIPKIIQALEFYNDQVLRLYQENNQISNDIFNRNYNQKLAIIKSELKTIIDYLFNASNDFIWGTLTPRQKNDIYLALLKNRLDKEKTLINLIKILTNYTTLNELENNITKTKVLNRFLK